MTPSEFWEPQGLKKTMPQVKRDLKAGGKMLAPHVGDFIERTANLINTVIAPSTRIEQLKQGQKDGGRL
jgi:hypothetical protein